MRPEATERAETTELSMAASTDAKAEPEMLALAADSCAEAAETMLIDAEAKSWQRPSATIIRGGQAMYCASGDRGSAGDGAGGGTGQGSGRQGVACGRCRIK
jgi:hypothetical protein